MKDYSKLNLRPEIKAYRRKLQAMIDDSVEVMFIIFKNEEYVNQPDMKLHDLTKWCCFLRDVIKRTLDGYKEAHSFTDLTDDEKRVLELDKYEFAKAILVLRNLNRLKNEAYKEGGWDSDDAIEEIKNNYSEIIEKIFEAMKLIERLSPYGN